MNITLAQAQTCIAAARSQAALLNININIAVLDTGGHLVSFCRMDKAWIGAIDIALKKAKTACYFGKETGALGSLSQPGGPLFNIEHSNGGLITFPGGIPIKNQKGKILGAIGVSGSTIENDHAVAMAGVAAI